MVIESEALALLWAMPLPLGAALGVLLLGRSPNLRDAFTVVAGLATFFATTRLVGPVIWRQAAAIGRFGAAAVSSAEKSSILPGTTSRIANV